MGTVKMSTVFMISTFKYTTNAFKQDSNIY